MCCFQIDVLFSCLQQSMMDDGDDETFPSITVTVRKPLGYQITFAQSRKSLRIGLLVTNETPASSQFLIFFCACDAMQQDAAESHLSKITNKRCPRINAALEKTPHLIRRMGRLLEDNKKILVQLGNLHHPNIYDCISAK